MAGGDVVSAVSAGAGISLNFQPSAGSEVMILSCMGRTTTFTIGLYDGVTAVNSDFDENTSIGNRNPLNIKVAVNNSIYLTIYVSATGAGFTGIQIK